MIDITGQKLDPGQCLATPTALAAIAAAGQQPLDFLKRHLSGDWGDVGQADWQANDQALLDGERILSSYKTTRGDRVWIITEADRSATTTLLPDEY